MCKFKWHGQIIRVVWVPPLIVVSSFLADEWVRGHCWSCGMIEVWYAEVSHWVSRSYWLRVKEITREVLIWASNWWWEFSLHNWWVATCALLQTDHMLLIRIRPCLIWTSWLNYWMSSLTIICSRLETLAFHKFKVWVLESWVLEWLKRAFSRFRISKRLVLHFVKSAK